MPVLVSCTVSYCDDADIEHSIEVSASSLYEAVALALVHFRRAKLLTCDLGPATELTVRVSPPTEVHKLRLKRVQSWLDSMGRSPAEAALKSRLKTLLAEGD